MVVSKSRSERGGKARERGWSKKGLLSGEREVMERG